MNIEFRKKVGQEFRQVFPKTTADMVTYDGSTLASNLDNLNSAVSTLEESVGDTEGGLSKQVSDNETAINNLEDIVGDSSSGLVKDVSTLENTVGDSSSGLVKDVLDLQGTVGDSSDGLVKDVSDLQDTVGDSSSGLVKKVSDLENDHVPTDHSSNYTTYGVGKNDGTYGHVKLVSGNLNGQTYANGTAAAAAHTHSQYLTEHQDISGKAPNNHASTETTYGVGTSSNYGHVKVKSGDLNGETATDGVAASNAHTHSQYLTSHQDISGKAPNNHASANTTYGIGTDTNYGHVKLATGDMNGATHADGVAVSKNHTHSQYLTQHQDISGKANVSDLNTVSGRLGTSSDTANAEGTTAWSRIKNLESNLGTDSVANQIKALEDKIYGLGSDDTIDSAMDTLKEISDWILSDSSGGAQLISDVSTLKSSVGASSDTASASGTTAWSRIKNVENVASGKAATNHASTATTYGVGTDTKYGHVKVKSGDLNGETAADGVAASNAHTHSQYLTQHQDISGKAPNNHASTGTTYGVGTTNNYGHVKLATGDLNGATATDGVAASNAHTHSQYLTSHQDISGKANVSDLNTVSDRLGTSSDTASGTGTTAWSRIKNLENVAGGKAATNHASAETTYGVGTSTNYGHVKLATGDLNGATATDGVAASNAHTHSQYLTSHQDISGKAPNNHASTATTYGVSTSTKYGHSKLVSGDLKNITEVSDGDAAASYHTHSQYLTQHQDISGKAPNNHASADTTYGVGKNDGTYGHVTLVSGDLNGKTYAAGTAAASSHTHGQYLTSHQDISGKAPNNHASTGTTYGVGTTTNYGHVKLVTGDLKNATAADGVAASNAHTHSQYLTSHQDISGKANVSDLNTVSGRLGTSSDTADAEGTTAWSRIKNLESSVSANATAISGKASSSDLTAVSNRLGTSSDTANASGTTAWSRIKNLENAVSNDGTAISGKAPNNHASADTTYGLGTNDGTYGHVKLVSGNLNGQTYAAGTAAAAAHTHSQYLTSHQDISGKAPNNHASTGTTYGVGTSSNYGHVKIQSGDLNGTTAADGVAAARNHTHSQYLTSHQDISGKANTSDLGTAAYKNVGVANGVAGLGSDGKVPSSQLPSYVDDVHEGYLYNGKFYKESAHTAEIPAEGDKIYVDLVSNKTYRWSGTAYVVISETLAIGSTASTAAAGNHKHSVTAAGSVSSTFTGSAVTSGGPSGTTSVPNTNHTHSVTATGSVSSTFTGSAVTSGKPDTTNVVSVGSSDHTHSVTAAGSVSSTFSGNSVNSGKPDTTNVTSVATGAHTHTLTASGSISSTFTGSAVTSGKPDTTNVTSVGSSDHTHSVTAAGSVSSSFSGTAATSGAPSKTTSVASGAHTHSVTATGSVSSSFTGSAVTSGGASGSTNMPNANHTHNVTATGSVSSSFTGSAATSGEPSKTTSVASGAHTHSVTATGSVSSTFTGSAVTSGGASGSANLPNANHTHSVTATGSVSSTFTGSAVTSGKPDTTNVTSVASSGHTHSVTATGSVSSSFSGSAVTSGGPAGTTTVVTTLGYDETTHTLTVNTDSVASSGHTHSVTAAGSVSSSFSGTAATSGTPSGTTSLPNANHTHSVTASGSVSSSFSGSAATSGKPDTTNVTSVATGAHTHSVTAAGSVSSSFSGTSATVGKTADTNIVSVGSSDHTHSVTATGSVSSTFSGTAATSGKPDTTNVTSVANGSHTHSVTAAGSVSSSFTGSAATVGKTADANVVSVGSSDHTHDTTATGSVSSSFSGSAVTSGTPSKTTNVPNANHTHGVTAAGSVSSSFSGGSITTDAASDAVDMPNADHIHSVKATGSVSSSFTGSAVTSGGPSKTTNVPNANHTHGVTAAGSVSSSFSGSAATSGKPDTTNVTSVATGAHTHSVTAAGSVSSTFSGSSVNTGTPS